MSKDLKEKEKVEIVPGKLRILPGPTAENKHYHTYQVDTKGNGATIDTHGMHDHSHPIEGFKIMKVNGHDHGSILNAEYTNEEKIINGSKKEKTVQEITVEVERKG